MRKSKIRLISSRGIVVPDEAVEKKSSLIRTSKTVFPLTRILVATDFTEYGSYAVSSAASIARQSGAQLILLHAINRPLNSNDDAYYNYHNEPGGKTVVTNVKNKLDAILNQLHIKKSKTVLEYHAVRCSVSKTILKHADRHKADLIVMGAYGSTGAGKSLIGSNTQRVTQKAKIPVLIVKEQFEDVDIENMVLASKFYGKTYLAFPKMKKIMDLFHTNIHLLRVNVPGRLQRTQDSMKLMAEFSNEFDLEMATKNIYNDRTVEEGIINFTTSIQADLIAVTPTWLWRLPQWFRKRITNKLMKKSIKGILSMRIIRPVRAPRKRTIKVKKGTN